MDFTQYTRLVGEGSLPWQEEYDAELSSLITEARSHAGLTQEALAGLVETTQSSIARAESGATLPSHGLLKRIAAAAGMVLLPPRLSFPEVEAGQANRVEAEAPTLVSLDDCTFSDVKELTDFSLKVGSDSFTPTQYA